ncbi:hypothetical protein [Nannocystis pusilla]|uniref:hypothetical protein n=1 Tax=Nannocystis pusilla TaxID=889268 RepID=UPI003B805436
MVNEDDAFAVLGCLTGAPDDEVALGVTAARGLLREVEVADVVGEVVLAADCACPHGQMEVIARGVLGGEPELRGVVLVRGK